MDFLLQPEATCCQSRLDYFFIETCTTLTERDIFLFKTPRKMHEACNLLLGARNNCERSPWKQHTSYGACSPLSHTSPQFRLRYSFFRKYSVVLLYARPVSHRFYVVVCRNRVQWILHDESSIDGIASMEGIELCVSKWERRHPARFQVASSSVPRTAFKVQVCRVSYHRNRTNHRMSLIISVPARVSRACATAWHGNIRLLGGGSIQSGFKKKQCSTCLMIAISMGMD